MECDENGNFVITLTNGTVQTVETPYMQLWNQFLDEMTVYQMNVALSQRAQGEMNIYDVYAVLAENNIDAENYKPLLKDRYFFYYGEKKQIIYTNGDYDILYPKSLAGETTAEARETWVSLSGAIKETNVKDVVNGATATVDTAEELVSVFKAVANNSTAVKDLTTVNITDDVNLMGAELQIPNNKKATLTINGNGKTISGLANLEAARENESNSSGTDRNYFGGIVAYTTKSVVFENINIENATVGTDTASMVGIFVGHAAGANTTVTLRNVKVNNVTVRGMMKVGAFVGQLSNGAKLVVENSTISNISVEASVGFAAKFVGLAHGSKNLEAFTPITADKAATYASGITVSLVKNSKVQYVTDNGKEYATDMNTDWTYGTNDNGKKEYCLTITQGYAIQSWAFANDDAQTSFKDGVLKYQNMQEIATL